MLLICEGMRATGSKGDQLHGGGTGLPQVRGLVSRIALLLFDVDLTFFSAVLKQCVFFISLFFKAAPIPSTARRTVALGAWKADPGNWS